MNCYKKGIKELVEEVIVKSKKLNVLIFPAGENLSVELHNALSTCVNIGLYGASSIDRHGEYIFKNYISGLPMITDTDFIDEFNKVLKANNIDLIFPTHDTVEEFLAINSEKLAAKIVAPDKRTASICRDKKLIFELFKDCDFCPEIYSKIEKFPVFIKPRNSQGGNGSMIIKSGKDIPANVNWNEYVISEYLPGIEYTVDCLTDKDGRLRFVSPRSRKRTMAGIAAAGKTEQLTPDIQNIAECINSRLKFLGIWNFQIKKDVNGKWRLLETAARAATSSGLTRALGVNLPLLSVYTAAGYDIEVFQNQYNVESDAALIRRYKIDYDYQRVYFDFDDTLVIEGKVHLPAIWFLYQCKNLGKKVVLLTKHEKEIYKSLENYCIDKNLFSEIIHIAPDDNKADYINPQGAVFIDNAYKERYNVHKKHNIPVFDVDGIEVLMDWRN